MFRRIQNESLKKDCIWVRIRGAFLAKKGVPKLNFHREGGAVAPICPLNPPLPLARLNGRKLAKSIPLARLEGLKKHTLVGGTSPGTFTMEEPPPCVSNILGMTNASCNDYST